MRLAELEENIERMIATMEFYQELLATKTLDEDGFEALQVKARYAKEQLLRLTLTNTRLIKRMEKGL
ncbi:hypothetical protein JXB02_04880 [Candidatus Woesearchaeota archaeon]|nr:hypothetical protein [Candidatus Woesearchaeota archaeon]